MQAVAVGCRQLQCRASVLDAACSAAATSCRGRVVAAAAAAWLSIPSLLHCCAGCTTCYPARLPSPQKKAVAAAVAEAVAKAKAEGEAAAAEVAATAAAAAAAEARKAAVEETTNLLVDVMYLGTVSTGQRCAAVQLCAAAGTSELGVYSAATVCSAAGGNWVRPCHAWCADARGAHLWMRRCNVPQFSRTPPAGL